MFRAWLWTRKQPGWRAARRAFLRDLRRDLTSNRLRRLGQAMVLAQELPPEATRLHAHFLHTPASVARYAALIRGLPWTVSAHAKDIWTTPDWEIAEKLGDCAWAVTCTADGARHLAALAPDAERVRLVYHGLDASRFPSPKRQASARTGSDARDPLRLLSVGRAVPKKGYDDLLEALARLPANLNWRLVHIGGGPMLEDLQSWAAQRGLSRRIDWRGPQAQEAVLAAYREADLFVLASRVAADGDRDGLPNVLLEAQSQRVAVLATRLPAIAELIEDGVTGALVPPANPAALAAALERLIRSPIERAKLAGSGEARVRAHFTLDAGIDALAAKFGLAEKRGGEQSWEDSAPCASRSMRR